MARRGLACLACQVLFVFLCASRPWAAEVPVATVVAADPRLHAIRVALLERVASGELPSVAIGVLHEGRVLWEEALGWARVEGQVPATNSTPYRLVSLGKSVTATGVLVLAERDRLDLDQPIVRYLGDPEALTSYEGDASKVTVRHVLNMTAAIPHGNISFFSEKHWLDLSTSELVRQRGILVFPPGEVFVYSNFAYAVLEKLIEDVGEVGYPKFISREVFLPLGMRDSFVQTPAERSSSEALGYGPEGAPESALHRIPRSSHGVYASLRDLLRYARFHLKGPLPDQRRILSDRALDTMHRERPDLRPESIWALGWGSIDLGDGRLWLLTNGRGRGAQATLSLVPGERLAVVCLTNVTGNVTDDIAVRVSDALVPGFAELVSRKKANWEKEAHRPYEPTEKLLGRWRGTIRTAAGELPISLEFQVDGDVHVALEGQYETLLTGLQWEEGLLLGEFIGRLPLEHSTEHLHPVSLALRPSNGRISGYATAIFSNERGTFALPTYLSLAAEQPRTAGE